MALCADNIPIELPRGGGESQRIDKTRGPESTNLGSDEELFMTDAYRLSLAQRTIDFEGIATARNPAFEKALRAIFRWQKSDSGKLFVRNLSA